VVVSFTDLGVIGLFPGHLSFLSLLSPICLPFPIQFVIGRDFQVAPPPSESVFRLKCPPLLSSCFPTSLYCPRNSLCSISSPFSLLALVHGLLQLAPPPLGFVPIFFPLDSVSANRCFYDRPASGPTYALSLLMFPFPALDPLLPFVRHPIMEIPSPAISPCPPRPEAGAPPFPRNGKTHDKTPFLLPWRPFPFLFIFFDAFFLGTCLSFFGPSPIPRLCDWRCSPLPPALLGFGVYSSRPFWLPIFSFIAPPLSRTFPRRRAPSLMWGDWDNYLELSLTGSLFGSTAPPPYRTRVRRASFTPSFLLSLHSLVGSDSRVSLFAGSGHDPLVFFPNGCGAR